MKVNPEIVEFRKEAGELNNLLAQQQATFCHKIAIIQGLCQSRYSLVNQLSDLRTYCKEIEEKISNFVDWQDSSEGRSVDLPKIEESQKDIVFQEWEIELKHAEMEIFSARDISNNIMESINDSLL